jgi:hypothetical protein
MVIFRGFSASGISRTRSMESRPLLRSAPFTLTWSALVLAVLNGAFLMANYDAFASATAR